jgi:mono/diheme cytochrome c family protein
VRSLPLGPQTADRRPSSISHPSSFISHSSSFFSPSTVYTLTGTGRLLSTVDGAKIYKQWCSTCHGDKGQGLTEEFRATWPEGKQNCWQAKCHAGSHPPDGFSFPKTVPALIGPETLTKFSTAQDLYAYTRAAMPYWSPNLLSDEEYLAITTFLVEANLAERNLAPPAAWPDDLAAVSLRPADVIKASMNETEEAAPAISWLPLILLSSMLVLAGLGGWLRYRVVR